MLSKFHICLVTLIVSIFFATGCTQNNSAWKERLRQDPPRNSQQAKKRFLADSVQENDLESIARNTQAQFRVLNSKHGLYEFSNVSIEELQESASHLYFSSNQFLPFAKQLPMPPIKPLELESCQKQPNPPVVQLLTSHEQIFESDLSEPRIYLNIGETLKLDASESEPHKSVGGELKIAFAYTAPSDSNMGEKVTAGSSIEFSPDSMGIYKFEVLVQDQKFNCARTEATLIVSGNTPYNPKSTAHSSFDKTEYPHLAEIGADSAQRFSNGNHITIAILDTGVNYNHPDLVSNIAIKPDEIPGNSIDDDGNGYIDDTYGFDFYNSDSFPFDDIGHGSHVAGLAAASTFGVAPGAKILPLKVIGHFGGDVGSITGAVYYAVNNGAQIINMSLGASSTDSLPQLQAAMDYAHANQVLIVASSGNGHPFFGLGMNNDFNPIYPASFENKNLISVAAKDSFNDLSPYSNYGVKSVDLTAPGGLYPNDLIQSSYMKNPREENYIGFQGTSMAAPMVSGVAALILSMDNRLTPVQLKEVLLSSGDKVESMELYTSSGTTLNAKQAVKNSLQ